MGEHINHHTLTHAHLNQVITAGWELCGEKVQSSQKIVRENVLFQSCLSPYVPAYIW